MIATNLMAESCKTGQLCGPHPSACAQPYAIKGRPADPSPRELQERLEGLRLFPWMQPADQPEPWLCRLPRHALSPVLRRWRWRPHGAGTHWMRLKTGMAQPRPVT